MKAFTLLELIFVIVIIGVLASLAVPKFSGLSDNAKVSAELSTAASVQVAIDACHGEWIVNEGSFTCGSAIASTSLNTDGYPDSLDNGTPLSGILKNAPKDWSKSGNNYFGPATDPAKGATCKASKPDRPCKGKHWEYSTTTGLFELKGP